MTDTAEAQTTPSGWEGILDSEEKVLWQGRPDPGFYMPPGNLALVLFGMFFAGFAIFWMIMASMAPGPFWMFGLIFFFIGMGMVLNSIFGTTFRQRRTWYTLTDRRAFVATDLPVKGRGLKSYPIKPDTVIDYQVELLASIHFATEYRTANNSSYRVPIGFERIAEGEEVMRLIREVQRGMKESSV